MCKRYVDIVGKLHQDIGHVNRVHFQLRWNCRNDIIHSGRLFEHQANLDKTRIKYMANWTLSIAISLVLYLLSVDYNGLHHKLNVWQF